MKTFRRVKFFVTCEHASNAIPKEYQDLFSPRRRVKGPWGEERIKTILEEHWGSDLGALKVAKYLHTKLKAPLHTYPLSRLFLEGNRYLQKSLFSVLTSALPLQTKEKLIQAYWIPHVRRIESQIKTLNRDGASALHIGIHSFTPERNGVTRQCDIGILFNPKRPTEKKIAHQLQKELQRLLLGFRIRRNYPYVGYSEGLSKFFGKRFADSHYIGIEIEINNQHIRKSNPKGRLIQIALVQALQKLIQQN